MKAFDYAELYLNTEGRNGERELREYVAAGGDIQEKDRDGMSAMDIAKATELHDKSMRRVAPRLVEIIAELGGV
jgi:hypothetical protein